MPRRRKQARVNGPYRHGRRYRVLLYDAAGRTIVESFETKAEAQEFAEAAKMTAPTGGEFTVGDCRDEYEMYLREVKGNKESSVTSTLIRLKEFFPRLEILAHNLKSEQVQGYYDARVKKVAVDTHRNELAEVKTFFNWCVMKGYMEKNPASGIVGVGRRRKGKRQFRIDEARKFMDAVLPRVMTCDAALAMSMALVQGLRQSEVTQRVVRDLDDGGRVLWIPDSKTENGQRRLEVPEVLKEALLKRIEGKQVGDLLFPSRVGGVRTKNWLKDNVKRVCRDLSLPVVTAHGLRGTHSTLSKDAGQTAHAVAAQLGHGNPRVTRDFYDDPGTEERQSMRKMLKVLKGGKKNDPTAPAEGSSNLVTKPAMVTLPKKKEVKKPQ